MPHASNCPNCGRPSPSNVAFCASCGSALSSASGGKGWKLFIGAFVLFVGLLWAGVIYTRTGPTAQPNGAPQPQALIGSSSELASAASQTTQPAPTPPLTLTSAQHLAEAKRALADGYKPGKDPRKTQWGEVAAAKWHLRAVGPASPEYREAQELLKEVARRERQAELARKQAERDEDSDETDDEEGDDSAETSSTASSPSSSSSTPGPTRTSPPASSTGGGSSSDYYTNSRGVKVRRPTQSPGGPPAGATAQCRDGTYSFSQSRRGTCSHHGGVARWL